MYIDYDEIVREWAYRVPNGKPNLKNPYHKEKLKEVLKELNYPLNLLTKLIQKTKSSFKAIEITNLPDGSYVFQLKPEYSSTIGRKYASRPMLAKATQKTLSYIAYEQPISSKQLVEVRGTGVYSHLKDLTQLDFIEHQTVGRYKIYTTTEKFRKYFGIQGDDDTLRQKLFKKVRTRNTAPSTVNYN